MRSIHRLRLALGPGIGLLFLFLLTPLGADEPLAGVTAEPPAETEPSAEFATFADALEVHDLPSALEYLHAFISWRHWRYWVGTGAVITATLALLALLAAVRRIFPEPIRDRLGHRQSKYPLLIYLSMVLLGIGFTFAYPQMLAFFSREQWWRPPDAGSVLHWSIWALLPILAVGGVISALRDLFVFRWLAPYTILVQAVGGVLAGAFITCSILAAVYIAIAIAVALGLIFAVILAFILLMGAIWAVLASGGGSSRQRVAMSDEEYAAAVDKINQDSRRLNEETRRRAEQGERFNREAMKKSRGW